MQIRTPPKVAAIWFTNWWMRWCCLRWCPLWWLKNGLNVCESVSRAAVWQSSQQAVALLSASLKGLHPRVKPSVSWVGQPPCEPIHESPSPAIMVLALLLFLLLLISPLLAPPCNTWQPSWPPVVWWCSDCCYWCWKWLIWYVGVLVWYYCWCGWQHVGCWWWLFDVLLGVLPPARWRSQVSHALLHSSLNGSHESAQYYEGNQI